MSGSKRGDKRLNIGNKKGVLIIALLDIISVGMPGDNAWSESFFANLQKGQVPWWHFKTIDEARQVLFDYIEVFYNRQRVQKRLGYLNLSQWLKQWQQ